MALENPFPFPGAYKGFISTRQFCSLSFRKILGGKILTDHPLFIQVQTVFILAGRAYELGNNKTGSYSTTLDSKPSAKHVQNSEAQERYWISTVPPIYNGHSDCKQHKK